MYKILYVEDEIYLAKVVKESLERLGHEVLHLPDGRGLPGRMVDFAPDICLLDIMLPYKNGYEIAKDIRSSHNYTPIIFLTAKGQTQDLIKGFEAGGNDYLRKPFSIEELNMRINNLIQLVTGKSHRPQTLRDRIALGKYYTFYPLKQMLEYDGTSSQLSFKEAQILSILCRNVNAATQRKDLLIEVWNDDSYFNSRNLDVYIRKIRHRLEKDPKLKIITLKGVGYHFVVESDGY